MTYSDGEMNRTLWWMHALGKDGLPPSLHVRGLGEIRLEEAVKHDFWAATGFYRVAGDQTRVVVKLNRRESLLGLPMRWTGRWLSLREKRAYRKLRDVPNIPALIGVIGDTGLVHAYVDGAPLGDDRRVPDDFFDALLALIDQLELRGIVYVDTNKPENILHGADGRPHLIDFQISFDANAWWPPVLGRWLLGVVKRGDVYHCLKHKRRFRPDQLSAADREILDRAHGALRLHRAVTKPYFVIRRPIMRWLQSSGRVADAGSN